MRLDVARDIVARLAVSRTVTRADYTALSAFTSLTTTGMFLDNNAVGGGTAGNPDIKPIRSNNFDANVEWYAIEQDICQRDPFESLRISYTNLRAMGLE